MERPNKIDFAERPMLVYWESTRACALACRHCRASAMPIADPRELNTFAARRLMEDVASFGEPYPHVVVTGGDPLQRPDLNEVITYAVSLGIKVSVTPAATDRLTKERLAHLKFMGVDSIGLSLDGSNPARHDNIRQVPGTFDRTIEAARWAGEVELPLQVNTLVAQETADDLPAVFELLKGFPVMRWSLFFLISVGRGKELNELDPEEAEKMMHWAYDLSTEAPFAIKTTEAPSFRRVARERMLAEGMTPEEMRRTSVHRAHGVRDGNGIVFVSHVGEVFPSGFLPLIGGNVREQSLASIYRDSEVFRIVRDVDNFAGKCGECEYKKICGGSRARAFAHTSDPAGSDPICTYQPAAVAIA